MIAVLGANGQLGSTFCKMYGKSVIGLSKNDLNIVDSDAVERKLNTVKPSMVINCAGYTSVDLAETEEEKAYQVNTIGAHNVSRTCANLDIPLVHFSTDYVFDGNSKSPYSEYDDTNPINIYGSTKLKAEKAIIATAKKYFIIRTSWLFGAKSNFISNIITLCQSSSANYMFVMDQVGCPTYVKDLIEATSIVVASGKSGIYNVTNTGHTTWYNLAKYACIMAKLPNYVIPITTEEYNRQHCKSRRIANRPKYSVLSVATIEGMGIRMRPWDIAVREYIQKIVQ